MLIQRNADKTNEDRTRENRREALAEVKAQMLLLWVDEISNLTIGLWMDGSKFSWAREAPYQDLPRAVLVLINRPLNAAQA